VQEKEERSPPPSTSGCFEKGEGEYTHLESLYSHSATGVWLIQEEGERDVSLLWTGWDDEMASSILSSRWEKSAEHLILNSVVFMCVGCFCKLLRGLHVIVEVVEGSVFASC
jgi:hypothetical protein